MTNGSFEQTQRIINLISAKLEGRLTIAEQKELEAWLAADPKNKQLFDELTDNSFRNAVMNEWQPDAAELSLERVKARMQRKPFAWTRIAAAASVLVFLSVGGYFIFHKKPVQEIVQNRKLDIAPGHNRATLTLANGQKIILTKGLSGKLATQNKTVISATTNDIAYQANPSADQLIYNTLSTAKGERSPFPLVLADGTKVWLNAASSITFPVAFKGKERVVSILGEAYFEVAHNAAQPFKIKVNGQLIQDIGTAFDVNAYTDEPVVTTTLLQGSVKITANNNTAILMPGEQSKVTNGNIQVKNVMDADVSIAWKSGIFQFKDTPLDAVLRQVARWYDVDVNYLQNVPKQTFTGRISENVSLSGLLEILNYSGVQFSIEGKKLIVKNK